MTYRDNLDAALAQIDTLTEKKKIQKSFPKKKDLLNKIRNSFVNEPERWSFTDHFGFIDSQSGFFNHFAHSAWILDYSDHCIALCFHKWFLFWIKIHFVQPISNVPFYLRKVMIIDNSPTISIFCPSFRRIIRRRKIWALLEQKVYEK